MPVGMVVDRNRRGSEPCRGNFSYLNFLSSLKHFANNRDTIRTPYDQISPEHNNCPEDSDRVWCEIFEFNADIHEQFEIP